MSHQTSYTSYVSPYVNKQMIWYCFSVRCYHYHLTWIRTSRNRLVLNYFFLINKYYKLIEHIHTDIVLNDFIIKSINILLFYNVLHCIKERIWNMYSDLMGFFVISISYLCSVFHIIFLWLTFSSLLKTMSV